MTFRERVTAGFERVVVKLNELKVDSAPIFAIWAEENANLGSSQWHWAYGNGATTPSKGGIILPFDCELIAMTCASGSSTFGSQQIQIVKNETPNSAYKVTAVNGRGNINFTTPLSFSGGDLMNFRTLVTGGGVKPNTVTAWFRKV